MTLRFGTDGIRGVAGLDLTPEIVTAFGRAAARVLPSEHPFTVGRDTRRSGPMLEAALVAGLCAEGASVARVGVLPTPGVAFLARRTGGPGAMVSASHNPFPDNGIKCFAPDGRKLDDDLEAALEGELHEILDRGGEHVSGTALGGEVAPVDVGAYLAHLRAALDGRTLPLRVVVDCGNGAASAVAPAVLADLGADVVVLNATPDGTNINAGCGSTDPGALQRAVVSSHADAGLAFDGDADRLVAVDGNGELVDGDQILLVAALDLRDRDRLPGHAVVATVMSNLGLRRALEEHGVRLVETPVGDRHVTIAMRAEGIALGGEQSGHVIFGDLATTGDGILTGLVLLDAVVRSGRRLDELAHTMTRLPQVLRNVRVAARDGLEAATPFWRAVEAAEVALGADGRVLVRPSGTEPVVRIMVEAPTDERAEGIAADLEAALVAALGSAGHGGNEVANPRL